MWRCYQNGKGREALRKELQNNCTLFADGHLYYYKYIELNPDEYIKESHSISRVYNCWMQVSWEYQQVNPRRRKEMLNDIFLVKEARTYSQKTIGCNSDHCSLQDLGVKSRRVSKFVFVLWPNNRGPFAEVIEDHLAGSS